jgi:hypothetical protein
LLQLFSQNFPINPLLQVQLSMFSHLPFPLHAKLLFEIIELHVNDSQPLPIQPLLQEHFSGAIQFPFPEQTLVLLYNIPLQKYNEQS